MDLTRGTRAVPELCGAVQCQQQALLEASWWGYGTTDSIHYWGVSPHSGQKAAPAFTCCQSKIKQGERSPANSGAASALRSSLLQPLGWGIPKPWSRLPGSELLQVGSPEPFAEPSGPRCRRGRGKPSHRAGTLSGCRRHPPMAGGAGPRPAAPAVSLSDELHAIRRC